jgi:dipeptidyl aminopeptidase/acylaminoacyl peptidase
MDANGENVHIVYAIDNFKGLTRRHADRVRARELVPLRTEGREGCFHHPRRRSWVAQNHALGDDGGDAPNWSPDGKLILFRSNVESDTKQSQVYVVRPNGTGMKQLTHFKHSTIVTSSSFSPDGKWITLGATGKAGTRTCTSCGRTAPVSGQ